MIYSTFRSLLIELGFKGVGFIIITPSYIFEVGWLFSWFYLFVNLTF